MSSVTVTDFLIQKGDLPSTRFAARAMPEVQDGEVLLKVDRFALTANNITYAVLGEAMAYWQFFPASDAGFGRMPVWGFAEVIVSRHAGVAVGERLYGYLPPSTHLVVVPASANAVGFKDATAHRAALPAVYNHYYRWAETDARREVEHALLRPLFTTAFLIDDFLADQQFFGAKAVMFSSASSKTALGTAFALKQRGTVEVIGLTSARNLAFTERTGCYDRVLPYESLATLDAARPTIYVDMAGNGTLLHDVHHHFREALVHSCIVGGTHWEQRSTQHGLPGAKPAFFFAPTQVRKRAADWGAGGLEQRIEAAWSPFVASVSRWLEVVEARGPEAIRAAYLETLTGKTPPERGWMLAF